jgi:uncharacterized membrane protein YkvA (DUF1232 family)
MPTKTRHAARAPDTPKKTSPSRGAPKTRKRPSAKKSEELLLQSTAGVRDAEIDKVISEAEAIEGKANSGGPLDRFLDDIKTMISMVRAYVSKEYREMPIGTIAAIAGALLYVLTPFDFIPDFLAGVGLVDDAAVVSACLKLVAHDVRKFRARKSA